MESGLYHQHKVISDKERRQVYSVAPRFSKETPSFRGHESGTFGSSRLKWIELSHLWEISRTVVDT